MALHSEYVEKIKAQAQRIHKFNELDDAACESERLLLCSAIIKCADISNVVSWRYLGHNIQQQM